ncbi:MAG: hypothetical protein CVV06_04620 [Gammaproteobacteria bacterium HGW-Gammaproteobacteria-10]|nr:MAG: hypothetical protein CVV06_04620 [Gammaproteobacteria bacterium HGW-Gammaproteobacteria-10]
MKPIPGFRPAGQLKLFKIAPGDFVFACPKKSIQKTNPPGADWDAKGARSASARMARVSRHPEAAASCALTILPKVFGRAIPSPPKTSGFPAAPLTGCSRQNRQCSARPNGTQAGALSQIKLAERSK